MNDIFSNDAEISLLSILLNNPETVFQINSVKPKMMSSSPHQLILDFILELSAQGLTPDATLLVNKLETQNKLDLAGGRDYIKLLMSQKVPKDNILEFEKMITNAYKSKRFISMTAGISEKALQAPNVDELITGLKEGLDSLTSINGGDATFSLGEALPDIWKGIVDRVSHPGIVGKTTGWQQVDLNTGGVCKGDYWVVAARPSIGKTAIACNSMIQTAKKGTNVLLFSREMSKQPIVERLVAIESRVPISDIRLGNINQQNIDSISSAVKSLKDLPIHIDTSFTTNPDYIESTIRKYVRTYGTEVVYIDYLQLLSSRGEDATSELGRISKMIKLLATNLQIGVVVLSQLNREVEYRPDKRPILSDLRQCGNIEEDADVVIGLYRDEYYNKETPDKGVLEFIIRKQRQGPVGTIRLKMNMETNYISD